MNWAHNLDLCLVYTARSFKHEREEERTDLSTKVLIAKLVWQLPGERPCESAETRHTSPQPSRHVRRKGAAPLSAVEEQTARAFWAYAMCACLLSLQMGSII